ncbi:MAG TPA: hypothetical protein ENK32_10685, partial [Anaerolineae bacterium]|nr:hypothetical protein [Anaerolineae bacterium]
MYFSPRQISPAAKPDNRPDHNIGDKQNLPNDAGAQITTVNILPTKRPVHTPNPNKKEIHPGHISQTLMQCVYKRHRYLQVSNVSRECSQPRTACQCTSIVCRNWLQSNSMSYTHYEDDAFVEALDYLYSFINFEKKRQDRYMAAKMDASRPQRFLDALGAPYRQFPSIHIAGTKGKGSAAAMSAYVLRAAGYRVGLYTSPHLQDFRERIRILTPDDADGRIPPAAFIHHINQIKTVVPDFPNVTWFEVLTAVAFLHFAQQKVDVAVVEVGLGGRLDATNVLTPLVSVITSLSID